MFITSSARSRPSALSPFVGTALVFVSETASPSPPRKLGPKTGDKLPSETFHEASETRVVRSALLHSATTRGCPRVISLGVEGMFYSAGEFNTEVRGVEDGSGNGRSSPYTIRHPTSLCWRLDQQNSLIKFLNLRGRVLLKMHAE